MKYSKFKIIKYNNLTFSKNDISILEKYCETSIPNDLKELLSTCAQGDIPLSSDINIGFGDISATKLIENYNTITKKYITVPAIVFGVDGNGNSLIYAKKSKSFKIYILSDSDFDEQNMVLVCNSLNQLSDTQSVNIIKNY